MADNKEGTSTELATGGRFNQDFEYMKILVQSKQIPCTSVEQAFTVAEYGKKLGFPAIVSFSYIFNQKGRLTISAAGIRAILIREGVAWETIHDASWVYNDGSVNDSGYLTTNEKGQPIKPVDRITKLKFTRTVKGKNGTRVMTEYGTFMMSTAIAADLVKNDSAWKKYPINLLYARAFTNGANRIASDLLMGLYSTDVIADELGTDEKLIVRDDNGEILTIKQEPEKPNKKSVVNEEKVTDIEYTEAVAVEIAEEVEVQPVTE